MSNYLLVVIFSILISLIAQADEPVAPPVEPRAQLCTELENFFRANPAGSPELLTNYFQTGGRNPNLLASLPRNRSYPALYRRLSRAHQRGVLTSSCSDLIPEDSARRARGSSQARFRAARSVDDRPAGVLDGKTHSPRRQLPPEESEEDTADYCKEKNNCRDEALLTGVESQGQSMCVISQTLLAPSSSAEDRNQCACLSDLQAMQCTPFDRDAVSENVKSAVLQTFGQNFLNAYAQLREDTNFYEKRIPGVTGRNPRNFSCSSFAGFEARVRRECRGQSNIEGRMQNVLNAFSNLQPGTAASMFDQTNAQILRMPGETGINRDFADFNRQVLSNRPELLAVEKMIQACLKGGPNLNANEWIRERIPGDNGSVRLMPFEKIAQLLKRKAFENPTDFINRYLNQQSMGDSYQTFVDYINTPANKDDTDTGNNLFQRSILQLMTGHPGFDNLLSSEKYARRVASRIPATEGGLRDFLEGPDSGLVDDFIEQCEDLQENFAALVCADDRELLGNLSRVDLQDAVSRSSPDTINPQNIDRLRCQVAGNLDGDTDGIFQRLLNGAADSDYYNRQMSPSPSSTMGAIADNLSRNRADYTRALSQGMAGAGNSIKPYVPVNDPVAEALFSEHPEISGVSSSENLAANRSGVPAINNSSAASERKPDAPVKGSSADVGPAQPSPGVISPAIVPTITQPVGETESKRVLRDSLARGAGQETVNNLISNIDDGAASELARLREELALTKQQQMQDIANRTQQLTQKMRNLEREQTRLQDLNDTLARPVEPAAAARAPASISPGNSGIVNPSRAQVQSSAQSQTGQPQENGNGTTSGSALAAPGSASLARIAGSGTAVRAGGIVVSRYAPTANGGPVTVDLPAVAAVNGDVPAEDVNRNIKSYLEQNTLDLSTLIQIKESGMLFRYRVNERGQVAEREVLLSYANLPADIKSIIDQRILSARATPEQINRISSDLRLRRRNYSYETLRAIIVSGANGTLR
ncbi:MAG: hypothetical protein V4598_17660 [Bdellovibrionota bacterium]